MIGATTEKAWPEKPSPCRRCKKSEYCAINNTACLDFYRYVQLDDSWPDSKVRTPTKEYYTRIYRISGYERNRMHLNTDGETSGSSASVDASDSYLAGVER